MDAFLPETVRVLTFREKLPGHLRHCRWHIVSHMTLTLPTDKGRYTAYVMWNCAEAEEPIGDVAHYGGPTL